MNADEQALSRIPAHLLRHHDILPPKATETPVTLIGVGAVGSLAAVSLAKMGFSDLTVYDPDVVSEENRALSWYGAADVGQSKATALRYEIAERCNIAIDAYAEAFTEASNVRPGIIIASVDSMEARNLIWRRHAGRSPATRLIIDPRMGAEVAACYAMRPHDTADAKTYGTTLVPDGETITERCTAKGTMYTAMALAAHVVRTVKCFLVGESYPRIYMVNYASGREEIFWKARDQ